MGGKLDDASEMRIEATLGTGDAASEVHDTIKKLHSDETPMIIRSEGTKNIILQVTVSGVPSRELGRSLVEKRLAGCAQLDEAEQTLFVKTPLELGEAVQAELDKHKVEVQEIEANQ